MTWAYMLPDKFYDKMTLSQQLAYLKKRTRKPPRKHRAKRKR